MATGLSRSCSCHSVYTGVREGKEDEVYEPQNVHTHSPVGNTSSSYSKYNGSLFTTLTVT